MDIFQIFSSSFQWAASNLWRQLTQWKNIVVAVPAYQRKGLKVGYTILARCQWSVASGQLPVASCQLPVTSGQMPVTSCRWSLWRWQINFTITCQLFCPSKVDWKVRPSIADLNSWLTCFAPIKKPWANYFTIEATSSLFLCQQPIPKIMFVQKFHPLELSSASCLPNNKTCFSYNQVLN